MNCFLLFINFGKVITDQINANIFCHFLHAFMNFLAHNTGCDHYFLSLYNIYEKKLFLNV